MDLNSPRLRAVLNGDDRHPREIADALGKAMPQESPAESKNDFFEPRMDKTVLFNPAVGGVEFPEEGAIFFCEQIKEAN